MIQAFLCRCETRRAGCRYSRHTRISSWRSTWLGPDVESVCESGTTMLRSSDCSGCSAICVGVVMGLARRFGNAGWREEVGCAVSRRARGRGKRCGHSCLVLLLSISTWISPPWSLPLDAINTADMYVPPAHSFSHPLTA